MKIGRIVIIFVVLLLVGGIAFMIYSINSRLQTQEYMFQIDAVFTAAEIASGEDPLTTDPGKAVTAEYEGRKVVVVPGNFLALTSYLRKDAAAKLFPSVDKEKALKLTVCDVAEIWVMPKSGDGDVVYIDMNAGGRSFHVRTDGGNQWKQLLACCMTGTYHDSNIPLN